MSSAAPPSPREQSQFSSGEDWDESSSEAEIQWLEEGKWGWVIYRCSYAKEFDAAWDALKYSIQQGAREVIARSGAPGIADTMNFVFVDDPVLEGASIEQLRQRFQAWARDEAGSGVDGRAQGSQGSRYGFFVKVDGEGLWSGYVGLIKAWPEAPGSEDWMKVRTSAVGPEFYAQLDNPEAWYMHYTPPESGVCNAW